MRHFYLLFCLIIASCPAVFSQTVIDESDSPLTVENFDYLVDEEATLSFDQVRESGNSALFQAFSPDEEMTFSQTANYWIRFSLKNGTPELSDWILDFQGWSYVNVFTQGDDGSFQEQVSGHLLRYIDRDYPKADFNFIRTEIPPGATKTFYVGLNAASNGRLKPKGLAFKVRTKENADASEATLRMLVTGLVCIYLVIFLYNLFVYISVRDRAYLYYVIILASAMILIFGQVSGYSVAIFANSSLAPAIGKTLTGLSYTFGTITLVLFMIEFLQIKSRYKRWHRFFVLSMWVFVPLIPLVLINFEVGEGISAMLATLQAIAIFIFAWKSIRDRYPSAVYFFVGYCTLWIGGILNIMDAVGVVDGNLIFLFGPQLGHVVEIVFFSFALANRINVLTAENSRKQKQIILQLKQNEQLQTKVNRELEEKVEERTHEIIEQQRQIEAATLALERERADREIREANLDKEKAQASENLKKQFFSRITHEFRTPLTLILGPLEDIMKETNEVGNRRRATFALRNSKILLRLINQLLGLSKLEDGQESIRLERRDLVNFVSDRVNAFLSISRKKEIQLSFQSAVDSLQTSFDPDKMEKVLNNLLSNALKFTKREGSVQVRLTLIDKEEKKIRISIKDTGIGIPMNKLPFIFDRFYQVHQEKTSELEGTGLGLALSLELVQLHGGDIKVSSIEDLGSEFTITLPIDQEGKVWESNSTPSLETSAGLEQEVILEESLPTVDWDLEQDKDNLILLIEDNPNVRDYVRMSLEPRYKVIEATNGTDGIRMALEYIPDLIISDVMMPGANGYEVSKQVKTDEKTSHVPLILLTARAAFDDKITGLATGADAYLSKPFNTQELKLRVENLIENQRKIREQVLKESIIKPNVLIATSLDDKFLQRLKETMEQELDNEKFSVEDMAASMAMSRTQLHRKLKALTNQNVSEYMRNYRLEYGYQLLKQNAGSVTEIAFQVGFSSASYFSKSFSAKFGISPKVLRTQGK